MWIGGLKIKSCNYPPLHSRALAVQRFKASGLPLPVLVIMYMYLPTRTHARTHDQCPRCRRRRGGAAILQQQPAATPTAGRDDILLRVWVEPVISLLRVNGETSRQATCLVVCRKQAFWRIRRRFGFQLFSPGSRISLTLVDPEVAEASRRSSDP